MSLFSKVYCPFILPAFIAMAFASCSIPDTEDYMSGMVQEMTAALDSIQTVEFSRDSSRVCQVLDSWHQAAATADEDTFFGHMVEDAVYLGTDKTEHWQRVELRDWSAKYFDRDTAWAFTPHSRHVYTMQFANCIWFDELLDTRFGICRGSGVMIKNMNDWKIAHYNLALTIDNDRMDKVMVATEVSN